MAQQTAVEWLWSELDSILELYPSEWEKVSKAVEQAKAMYDTELMNKFGEGYNEGLWDADNK